MHYSHIEPATFLSRPNRFVALVRRQGESLAVHVKNTGRCAELLTPGAAVYLERSENPARKTLFDLVAVQKGAMLVNMDSAAPNAAAKEWLAAGGLGPVELLRPEYRLGGSRFDFYAEQAGQKMLVEVKGCTLETARRARFPDAPTLRGLKHVNELAALAGQGWRCCVLIVLQMKGPAAFEPNWATHPQFGEALRRAAAAGVEVLAYDCRVTPESMTIDQPVPVEL